MSLLYGVTAFTLAACDPGVFEFRLASAVNAPDAAAVSTENIGARTQTVGVDAGVVQFSVGGGGEEARVDRFGSVGSAARSDGVAIAGTGGATGSGAAAREAMENGADGGVMETVDAGSIAPRLDAGSIVPRPGCPSLPTEHDESFCYDFENGVNGPSNGSAYDLWTTPELAIANQLTAVADPGDSRGHVLQTQPSLTASEPSAALGHSTRPFENATIELDVWLNDALIQADEDVSWFRYVPTDGDYEHVWALLFRRGQALLRTDGTGAEHPFSRLPRSDGKPTHVRLHLSRLGSCSSEVWLDDQLVASASEERCPSGASGYVEFGLLATDRRSQLRAFYDNIAFTRR